MESDFRVEIRDKSKAILEKKFFSRDLHFAIDDAILKQPKLKSHPIFDIVGILDGLGAGFSGERLKLVSNEWPGVMSETMKAAKSMAEELKYLDEMVHRAHDGDLVLVFIDEGQ